MENNLDQNVNFILNAAEVRQESEQIRSTILGVGESAEQAVNRIEQSFENLTGSQRAGINQIATAIGTLETQLTEMKQRRLTVLDPTQLEVLNNQIRDTTSEITRLRNVGLQPMSGSFNGLQNSINQITRELPAFTFSAQTGFLAVSNNIPILVDELNRARVANQALTASGGTAVPVWKQLIGSLFSWGTALSLGVTLLTVYGKEIGNFIAALFRGKEAFNSWANQRKLDAQIQNDAIKNYVKEATQLSILKEVITDQTLSSKRRNSAVDEYNKIADLANQIDKKTIDNTALIESSINRQITLIQKRGLARAAESVIAQKAEVVFQKQLELNQKYPMYTDAAVSGQDDRAIKAINETAKKLGVKNINAKELLAQSLLPDEALKQMAAQDNKFSILLDSGTKKIIKEVNDRKRQIDAIRNNETGGYAGLSTSLKDVADAQADLDAASNAGLGYIKDVADKPGKAKVDKSAAALIDQRKALLERISEVDKEYARKTFTKDAEEVQALKDKFAKIITVVEQFNKKHPKASIDLTDFNNTMNTAVNDLIAQQEVEKSKIQIDKQKAIFDQFEQYKLDFGAQKAAERFGSELKGFESYVKYLESLMPEAGNNSAGANAMRDYLNTAIPAAEKDLSQKRFDNTTKELKRVLEATKTAATQRLQIELQYEKDKAALVGDKSLSDDEKSLRIAKLDEIKVLELKANQAIANQETKFYKDAMKDVTNASLTELKQRIKDAEKELQNAKLTPEQRTAVKGKLTNAQQGLSDKGINADEFGQWINENAKGVKQSEMIASYAQAASGSFYEMADALSQIAPGTAATLETLGDIAGVAGNAAKSFAGFASGDIVGGVTSAISAVAGVFAIGSKSRESARKAQQELLDIQKKMFQGEIDLNIEMRDRARTQQDINDLTNIELEARKKLLATQAGQSKSDYEKLLAQVQSGQYYTGIDKTEKYGGFLGIGKKTRVIRGTAGLAGQTYEQLEALSLSGKLDEATEAIFQNLKKSRAEMESIGDAASDTAEIITSKLTGGLTASSISSNIIQGVKDGKRAMKDFADDTEEMMANALLSALDYQLLSAPLKKIVADFSADAQDGLDESEIKKFKDGLGTATSTFLTAADAVEKATGIALSGKTNSNSSGAAGVVRAEITEETGGALVGRLNGIYDLTKQHYVLAKSSHEVFVESRNHLANIDINTQNTVLELQKAVGELKEINKNTKGSFGAKF